MGHSKHYKKPGFRSQLAHHGMQASAPTYGKCLPREHALQLVCAACSWNLPGLHAEQLRLDSWDTKVPGAHGEGTTEALLHSCPGGHVSQCPLCFAPVRLANRPGGQGVPTGLPVGQK